MKILKSHRGTTRIVFIFFSCFVLKFPRVMGITSKWKWIDIKRMLKKEGIYSTFKSGELKVLFERMKKDLYLGISANVTEGWLSNSKNTSFLHPATCFILFNFQKYAGEQEPTYEQLKPFFDSLSEKGKRFLSCIDPHQFEMSNWRIIDNKLKLIDYGGKLYDAGSFPAFLCHFKEEIEKELSKPIT